MSNLPNYITRDLRIESHRQVLHGDTSANTSARQISAADATAGLQYARYIHATEFQRELGAQRPEGLNAFPACSHSAGVPLNPRGKQVYETVLRGVGDMGRFGKQTLYRAIIERLVQLGAR